MGRYITEEDIKELTLGKVQYTDDSTDKNKMQLARLKKLIEQAESEVELDLSMRYQVPLVGPSDEAFKDLTGSLPSAVAIIRTVCQLQAVMKVLDTDYGRGSVTGAEKYYETMKKRYDGLIEKLVGKKSKDLEESTQFKYPPLGFKKAYFNTEADDGFAGMVLSISPSGDGSYPAEQINDPSESFFSTSVWE